MKSVLWFLGKIQKLKKNNDVYELTDSLLRATARMSTVNQYDLVTIINLRKLKHSAAYQSVKNILTSEKKIVAKLFVPSIVSVAINFIGQKIRVD